MSEETSTLNPSIVVLKTGEKLITILQEVFEGEDEDRKGICLLMNYPYELSLIAVPNEEDPEKDLQVKYSKWCPYSLESSYRIPYDGILTIGTPDPGLTKAYMAKVDVVKGAQTPETQPVSGSDDSPNWQQQQQLVKEAIKSAGVPPAIDPEVV
jgi:hypothetical protein